MSVTRFTVEEENMICIFGTSSRTVLMDSLGGAVEEFDEPELCEIANNVLGKLEAMTDAEFSELTFHPAYSGDDDD